MANNQAKLERMTVLPAYNSDWLVSSLVTSVNMLAMSANNADCLANSSAMLASNLATTVYIDAATLANKTTIDTMDLLMMDTMLLQVNIVDWPVNVVAMLDSDWLASMDLPAYVYMLDSLANNLDYSVNSLIMNQAMLNYNLDLMESMLVMLSQEMDMMNMVTLVHCLAIQVTYVPVTNLAIFPMNLMHQMVKMPVRLVSFRLVGHLVKILNVLVCVVAMAFGLDSMLTVLPLNRNTCQSC